MRALPRKVLGESDVIRASKRRRLEKKGEIKGMKVSRALFYGGRVAAVSQLSLSVSWVKVRNATLNRTCDYRCQAIYIRGY